MELFNMSPIDIIQNIAICSILYFQGNEINTLFKSRQMLTEQVVFLQKQSMHTALVLHALSNSISKKKLEKGLELANTLLEQIQKEAEILQKGGVK